MGLAQQHLNRWFSRWVCRGWGGRERIFKQGEVSLRECEEVEVKLVSSEESEEVSDWLPQQQGSQVPETCRDLTKGLQLFCALHNFVWPF